MNETMKKKVTVVLGMHRSGTSVVARGLQVLGVDLGDNLLAAFRGVNDKGFWEDADIIAFNEELLWTLGREWHTVTPILTNEFAEPQVDNLKQRAMELLKSKMFSISDFGLKDPRVSKLLPFWNDVFRRLCVSVSYVIAYRHPMSVVLSLEKRDGFAHEKSYLLWLQHMLAILMHTHGYNRVVVNYDRLMMEPERQLQRVANIIGQKFDPEGNEFTVYKNNFLDDTLRHSHVRADDLRLSESVPHGVIELHNILTELADGNASSDDIDLIASIERINRRFAENYVVLRYLGVCEEKIWELSRIVEKGSHLVAMAEKLLDQSDGHLAMVAADLLRQKDEHLATAAELLRQKDEHLATAAELLRQKDEHLATAAELIKQRN